MAGAASNPCGELGAVAVSSPCQAPFPSRMVLVVRKREAATVPREALRRWRASVTETGGLETGSWGRNGRDSNHGTGRRWNRMSVWRKELAVPRFAVGWPGGKTGLWL